MTALIILSVNNTLSESERFQLDRHTLCLVFACSAWETEFPLLSDIENRIRHNHSLSLLSLSLSTLTRSGQRRSKIACDLLLFHASSFRALRVICLSFFAFLFRCVRVISFFFISSHKGVTVLILLITKAYRPLLVHTPTISLLLFVFVVTLACIRIHTRTRTCLSAHFVLPEKSLFCFFPWASRNHSDWQKYNSAPPYWLTLLASLCMSDVCFLSLYLRLTLLLFISSVIPAMYPGKRARNKKVLWGRSFYW